MLPRFIVSMKEYFSHNRGLVIGVLLCFLLGGCAFFPFHGTSPTDGKTQVTREQLNVEIISFRAKQADALQRIESETKTFMLKAQASDAELASKETIATAGLAELGKLAEYSGLPIPVAASGMLSLLLGGALYDNKRKDTKILLQQNNDDLNKGV